MNNRIYDDHYYSNYLMSMASFRFVAYSELFAGGYDTINKATSLLVSALRGKQMTEVCQLVETCRNVYYSFGNNNLYVEHMIFLSYPIETDEQKLQGILILCEILLNLNVYNDTINVK